MYQTNQQSVTLANELNHVPSLFPIPPHSVVKLSLYAPSGKVNATFNFASIVEVRHFIELNQPPRYQVWG